MMGFRTKNPRRNAVSLPQLAASVADLEAEVAGHLRNMGALP